MHMQDVVMSGPQGRRRRGGGVALAGALALSLAVAGTGLAADVPATIAWQGHLVDPQTGVPIDATYPIAVALYELAEGGAPWCREEFDAVDLVAGRFSLELGAGCDSDLRELFAATPDVWIALTVDGEVLTPRIPLRSVRLLLPVEAGQTYEFRLEAQPWTAADPPNGIYLYTGAWAEIRKVVELP